MRERAWVAVLMAWFAGGVDSDGFMCLAHLFTAHLGGNTAAFAANFGSGNWHEAVPRLFPIPTFVIGVFLGSVIVDAGLTEPARALAVGRARRHSPPASARSLFPAFALEIFLILASLLIQRRLVHLSSVSIRFWGVAGMLSMSMGIQNAPLSRVGRTGVRTTYITGMLTNFAECAARCCFWFYDRTRGRGARRLVLALRFRCGRKTCGT